MSEPFLAEIRMVGFDFAPRGWALCDGQILPINQNQSLYSLLGTIYGGDGRVTFALPDLRGRVPIHADSSHPQGLRSGEETHTLTAAEMPAHRHGLRGSGGEAGEATQVSPAGGTFAGTAGAGTPEAPFYAGPPGAAFASGSIANAGGGQAHDNMQPFLALNFAIALQGLFPSRN